MDFSTLSFRRWLNRSKTVSEMLTGFTHDRTAFVEILERERMRADRSGRSFCLLHFSAPAEPECLLKLALALKKRLRTTDEIGLMPDGIAAVLPDTDRIGAAVVGRDVLAELTLGVNVSYRVLIHPEQPQDPPLGSPGKMDEENPGLPRSGLPACGEPAATGALSAASGNQPTSVDSMQTVFICPLPWWKRSLDILGASIGLLVSLPVLVLASVAIRLTSPGPVLFAQRRAGLGGRPFTIYKLRTMYVDAEARKAALRAQSEQDGPAFKLRDDPRITRIGWYLRKTCIDELPQLWNVLRGDMTLVGPRPLPVDESDGCQVWERRRLEITPGLTCIWQVHGGVRVTFAEWMRMDIRYMKSRSVLQDVTLLWQTFVKVLFHRASH